MQHGKDRQCIVWASAVQEGSDLADDEPQAECSMMLAAELCCMAALLAGRCETKPCVLSGQKPMSSRFSI